MITKPEKEILLDEIRKIHPDEYYTTKQLSKYIKFCPQTIKNYGYMGMPRLAKNKWYVPEVILWIQYTLPAIQERKKYELHN